MKNFGIREPGSVTFVGGNAKMNEFKATMGICNLRYLDESIEKRKAVVNMYINNLKNINGIKICHELRNVQNNYFYFSVVFDGYKKIRDELYEILAKDDIRKKVFLSTNKYI